MTQVDAATGTDTVGVAADLEHADFVKWQCEWDIHKYEDQAHFDAGDVHEHIHIDRNLLLNAGITRALNLLFGQGATQAFDATHCRLGAGDSSTAETASQTDLQAATNKFYKLVTSTPAVSGQTATLVAAFGASQGNFAWAEVGIDNGTADSAVAAPPMLNRKVAALGTKASPAVWTLTVTVTLA